MVQLVYLISHRKQIVQDCAVFQSYFKFLGWTQINERAVALAKELNVVPLPTSFRMYCSLSIHSSVKLA